MKNPFFIIRILILVAFFPAASQFTWAREIPVLEIQTSIHEQKLNGFRITLEKPVADVRTGLVEYLKEYPVQPLLFEDLLIYENLDYPAITNVRPLTFYYRFEKLDARLSTLTVVCLYGYGHAISAVQDPDLALRLLLDLSAFVQKLSGDKLNFDHLFRGKQPESLRYHFGLRKENDLSSFLLIDQPERIGSTGKLQLLNDPFSDNRPSGFDTEKKVLDVLSRRFMDYMEERDESVFLANTYIEVLDAYQDTVMALRDSLLAAGEKQREFSRRNERLRTSLQDLRIRESMVSASLDSLRKAIPATSETGVVVSEAGSIVDPGQEAELKHLRDRNFRMLSELYSLREQAAGMEGQLASLSSAHQTEMTALRKQMDEIRETGDKLRTQLEMTRKSTVAPANFLDSLKQLHNQVSIAGSDLQVSEAKRVALEKELRSMETENARLQSNADSSRREIRMLRSQLLSAGAISQDTDGRIRQLEVRLQRSEGNNTELEKALSAEKKKNSDLEQNLLRKEAAWKALETENASLRKKYLEQKERADTLILASVAGKTERKSLQREVESLGSRLKSAEAANIRLQEDLSEALGSRVAAEMESVRLQKDLQQAGKESERMRKGYMAAAERADSLRILVNRLDRRNRRLDARLDSLQTEIAILNPDSRIAQSRRQLYLEQLDKLLALQKELNKKEIDLINLETRLAQRQRYLSEFEATRDAAVLLDQIGALEQQLTALETMVEGLRKSDPSSGNSDPEIIIFQGKYKLAGKEIPSYVYENQSDPAYLEERIRTWFALKGVSAVSWKPVIRFEDVVLEDITFRPLDVSFFLYQDDKGQQYVLTSFQLPDGSYLTDSDRAGMGDSVRTWIRKLFD